LQLVGILFPHINDDARSKSHQIHISQFTLMAMLHRIFYFTYATYVNLTGIPYRARNICT